MEVYRFPQTIKVQDHPHVDDEREDEVLLRPEHGRQRELHPGGGGAAGEPHLQPAQYIISEIENISGNMTSRWRVRGTEDRASCLVTCWLVSRVSRHVLSGSENTWLLGTPGPGHVARDYNAVTVARVRCYRRSGGCSQSAGWRGSGSPRPSRRGRAAARSARSCAAAAPRDT